MRTKGKGAPDAEHPWNEIVPGLWMGGHHYTPPSGERTPAIVADEFDVVISMYRRDGRGPPDHVEHHYEALPDRPLTADQLETVSRLAGTAVAAVRQGRRVLVRCHSGYNRSGLVIAQSLVEMGYSADDAVGAVVLGRRSIPSTAGKAAASRAVVEALRSHVPSGTGHNEVPRRR